MNPIRSRFCVGLLLLAVFLLVGALQGQDKKKLPPLWDKLGLSDEQSKKIDAIQTEFEPKIEAVQKKVREAKAKEKEEMEAILTPEQKKKLKEITPPPKP